MARTYEFREGILGQPPRCQQGSISVAGAVYPEQGSPQQADRPAVLGEGDSECAWHVVRRGDGIWRDDAQGENLLLDNPVVIHCYTGEHLIELKLPVLRDFLHRMGR